MSTIKECKDAYVTIDKIVSDLDLMGRTENMEGESFFYWHSQLSEDKKQLNVKFFADGDLNVSLHTIIGKMKDDEQFRNLMLNAVRMFVIEMGPPPMFKPGAEKVGHVDTEEKIIHPTIDIKKKLSDSTKPKDVN